MSSETKTKYQVINEDGELIGERLSKRALTHALVRGGTEVISFHGSWELARKAASSKYNPEAYASGYIHILPVVAEEDSSSSSPKMEEGAELLVKGYSSSSPQMEEETPAPQMEEMIIKRVTPPQRDALLALGYEVTKSYKLRYLPSELDNLLETLYAEREKHTRGARRVYTALIDRVSTPKSKVKAAKGAARARFLPGDLQIEYSNLRTHREFMQLVDAAEQGGLISKASADALRSSTSAPRPTHHLQEEEDTGSSALARFLGDDEE